MIVAWIDISMIDHNNTSHEKTCEQETESELRNFGSDHGVDGRNLDELEQDSLGADKPPIKNLNMRHVSRRSISMGDVFSQRRGSYISMVSSLTMSNFEDSFFSDYGSQDWAFHDILEATAEEDEEQLGCSNHGACDPIDHKPICPMRRDSSSTGKISNTLKARYSVTSSEIQCFDHLQRDAYCLEHAHLTRRASRELPPVKPGRKDSVICLLDFIPVLPGRHESMSTFLALDLPGSELPTDRDTATTSTASLCFLRSEGKRSLFVE